MATQPIYQFYAELCNYKPKIWRRFQVGNHITMARLGYILMSMFEMQAKHLFCFNVDVGNNLRVFLRDKYSEEAIKKLFSKDDTSFVGARSERYEIFMAEDDIDYGDDDVFVCAAAESRVKEVVAHPKSVMDFNYDYGDNWHVSILLEEVFIDKELPGKELPRILEGAGYGIIEDCDGIPGLESITKIFKKKKGAQYREYCEWLGCDDFDITAFDVEDANLRVKRIPRIYADIYEWDLCPTQKSIDFLERKYKHNSPEN